MKRYALVLWLLLVFGCTPPLQLGPDFVKQSEYFAEAMRWKDFRTAARFLPSAEQEFFLEQFHRDKDLHMVDVRFEEVDLDPAAGSAQAVLLVEYYLLPSATVREWRWTQQWVRTDAPKSGGTVWQIETSPPAFP